MTRRIALLLGSTFLASTAALAGVTALGKLVYDLTDSELALGFLGLAEFLPALLLMLVVGAVADRFDRRRVTAGAAGAEACIALGLAAYVATEPTSATPIFALVLGFGVTRAFLAPASRSLPADIVPPSRLPWLVARHSITWQASIIVGPVLGGIAYSVDPALPFVFMAVLLALSSLAVIAIRIDEVVLIDEPLVEAAVEPVVGHVTAEEGTSLREALLGFRFIRRQPILLGAISLDLFAVLFGGAVALLPAIADDRLHVGAVGLGWLRAAGGIGAALVTIVLAIRPVQRHVGRVLLLAVAVFGAVTVLLGTTRSFVVAFVALAVLAGADSVSVFIRATLVPLSTPPELRGRVLAVENVFIGGSNELGAFESGVAGQLLGAPTAIVLGGVATVAIAGAWWFAFPDLKEVDRFPES
ncbi:MAG TPA: MFS transporter [Acidimicrobiales bacterium]|nr:MFS transporter [Acidimicrobiales bacterium]